MTIEHQRLSRQCEEILSRLQSGKVSNRELSKIALKYTGRISDLRKAGHSIECISHNRATGETWYQLHQSGPDPVPYWANYEA